MAIEQLDNSPRCQHVRLSGRRCKAPAKRGLNWCMFHEAEHKQEAQPKFPPVEDAAAVQVATDQVLKALCEDNIDFRRAALMFSGLRIARANLKLLNLELGEELIPAGGGRGYKKEEEDEGPSLAEYLLHELGDMTPEMEEAVKHMSGEEQSEFLIQRLLEEPAEGGDPASGA